MQRITTCVLLIIALLFSMASVGCNKEKAMKTVRDAENDIAKVQSYVKNLAKANNDAFAAGDISPSVQKATNDAIDHTQTAIDAVTNAIKAAKIAIAAGADPNGQVNIIEAVFNDQLRQAGFDLIAVYVNIPRPLEEKVSNWVAGLHLALDAFKVLFSDMRDALAEEPTHV